MLTFQELIAKLNTFWSNKGVLIGEPYGLEVGAGTSNPLTAFRVLGPEPFNVAYVEPSRRPADGRYGENPNRLQHYFQYQVILKPAPAFNTYMYIEMLQALGIDPEKHDIRFVEDNWESPSLGAWGLGWEIWLDGMEITQYTYFQQMSGIDLELPALEITIGLERLAMYIQNVDDYKDLKWNNSVTYGDIFKQHEYWQTTYNYETSDIKTLQTLFNTHLKIIKDQINKKNYWAAYDNLLKLSHYFNLLDAQGVVSATDRVAKFKLMGELGNKIAKMYIAERKKLNYPLTNKVRPIEYKPKAIDLKHFLKKNNLNNLDIFGNNKKAVLSAGRLNKTSMLNNKALGLNSEMLTFNTDKLFVLELGFEEFPAFDAKALQQIFTNEWLNNILKNLGYEDVKSNVYITSQRVVFIIANIEKTTKKQIVLQGPPINIAYKDSKATKALKTFLNKNNIKIADLKQENGRVVAYKTIKLDIQNTAQEIINRFFTTKINTKYMRWNNSKDAYIRPLRWIFAMYKDEVINTSYFDVQANNFTMPPRCFAPNIITLNSSKEYLNFILSSQIKLDPEIRHEIIQDAFKKESKLENINKYLPLIEENTFLTENPNPVVCKLPDKYKVLPFELILKILQSNQRYLVFVKDNQVYYMVVVNHLKQNAKSIAKANTKVVNARLDDGLFYFNTDLKKDIKEYRPDLKYITYHPQIGSYLEKTKRLEKLADIVWKNKPEHIKTVLQLIKNDKATLSGKEFPELEGYIASKMAQIQNYPKEVVTILQEYKNLNTTNPDARLFAIIDLIDDIINLASLEGLPKGNKDPYQIRQKVFNLIHIASKQNLDLEPLIKKALELARKNSSIKKVNVNLEEISDYINKRVFNLITKNNILDSYLALPVAFADNLNIFAKINLAYDLNKLPDNHKQLIFDTAKRINNIIAKKNKNIKILGPEKLKDSSLLNKQEKQILQILNQSDFYNTKYLLTLAQYIDKLFEKTLILDKDLKKQSIHISVLVKANNKLQKIFKWL